MGSRWVACCSWGSTERAQHYKSSSVWTALYQQERPNRPNCFSLFHHFLIGLGRMDKCLERAVSFNTNGTSTESLLLHPWDTLGCQSHSHTAGAAAKGKCCGNPQTALLFSVSITCSLSNICPVSILRDWMHWVFSAGGQNTSLQYHGFCWWQFPWCWRSLSLRVRTISISKDGV